MKKLKAFTINEMLVVLLITALVVGMAFSVLGLVQVQMRGISNNYKKNTELNLLRQSLWIDFNRFDRVWFDGPRKELLLVNGIDRATYRFEAEGVIREKDTFNVKLSLIETHFKGERTNIGEIDAIDLYTVKDEGGKRLFVFKRNSSTSYVDQ